MTSEFLCTVLIFLLIILLDLLGCPLHVRNSIAGHLLSFIFELKLDLLIHQLHTCLVNIHAGLRLRPIAPSPGVNALNLTTFTHAGLHFVDSHSELLQVVLRVPIYIVLQIFTVLVHMSLLESAPLSVLDFVRSLLMHILKLLIPVIGRLVFPTDLFSKLYDILLHLVFHLGYTT